MPISTLQAKRNLLRIRIDVLKVLQLYGYRDGIAAVSFTLQGNVLQGWFQDLGGQHYSFHWTPTRLTYRQTLQRLAPLTHTLIIPKGQQQQIRRKLPGEQRQALKDRGTFACGLSRVNRNRQCVVKSVGLTEQFRKLARSLSSL